jgi:hypothetical protein
VGVYIAQILGGRVKYKRVAALGVYELMHHNLRGPIARAQRATERTGE